MDYEELGEQVLDRALEVSAGDRIALIGRGDCDTVQTHLEERIQEYSAELAEEPPIDVMVVVYAMDGPYSFAGRPGTVDIPVCAVSYPTSYMAEDANMTYDTFTDMAEDALTQDYNQLAEQYTPLAEYMDAGDTVEITGKNTDITFSIADSDHVTRRAIIDDGTYNLPTGEVFTAPDPSTVDGTIRFDMPQRYDDHILDEVELTYEDGDLVTWDAASGADALDTLFETDEGAQLIGEFGIGTNHYLRDRIDGATCHPMYDEKIAGTIHMALGYSIPQSIDTHALHCPSYEYMLNEYGTNQDVDEGDILPDDTGVTVNEDVTVSTVHLDLVKDLRDTGTVMINDTPVIQDGDVILP